MGNKNNNTSNDATKKWYKIEITPGEEDGREPYVFKVETKDIEHTMESFQRNRLPFEWEIIGWDIRV